ncbi:MAG: hypothetical protein HY674_05600 [Chloroflexi bacterium]|nr:hypothetical protein [Chloroflexota bacterium]
MNLFCPFYEESQWKLSPQNAANNINVVGSVARTNVYTLDKNGGLLAVHEALVRQIVRELKGFDNVYYEICNEPYFGGVTMEWQHHIADVIVAAEKGSRNKHLISQNIANGSAKIQDPHPAVSIFNFHYASPPITVAMNYGLNKVIGDNETGFRGTSDLPYRVEAWEFILAGGGLFNHLDYSFTAERENGTYAYPATQPGGGNPVFRGQMKVLQEFINRFDFIKMKPDQEVIAKGVPRGANARALSEPGQAYAIYIGPAALPKDGFSVRWTGRIEPRYSETYTFTTFSNDGVRLWVNGQLIVDNWTDHSGREDSGTIALQAGKKYDLKLEYYQAGGAAAMKLMWSSPSQKKEVIPERVLMIPGGIASGLLGRYYLGKNFVQMRMTRTDAVVDFDWTARSPFAAPAAGADSKPVASLSVNLPPGVYLAHWLNPMTGQVGKLEQFKHPGGARTLVSPGYEEDIALCIRRN